MERDVLAFSPDLTVVSFGLNDCGGGLERLSKFAERLRSIFGALHKQRSEVIYFAPCMSNTYFSRQVKDSALKEVAEQQAKREKDGVVDVIEVDAEVAAGNTSYIPV